MARPIKAAPAAAATALALSLGACGHNPFTTASWGTRHSLSERECLARAMYFESNRSSEEGMTAVGTVVMNRLQSGRYPKTVCGVVGQNNQFAPGALSKPVGGRSWALALGKADAVLAGERHARVGAAMHFHTAGYTFPYRNMAYVVAAGGNVFYEKRTPGTFAPVNPNVLVAQAERERRRPSEAILMASAEEPAPVMRRAERPIERPVERPHLASLEVRRPSQETRAASADRQKAVRFADAESPPRARTKGERIRLAHLDDDDMPKALRQRSDASPGGRLGGVALPYKTAAAGPDAGRSKTSAPAVDAKAHAAPKLAKADPPGPAVTRGALRGAAGAQPPARQAVTAKSTAATDAAKLGWKRGAQPATADGKRKTRS